MVETKAVVVVESILYREEASDRDDSNGTRRGGELVAEEDVAHS